MNDIFLLINAGLNIDAILREIQTRQEAPFNNGRINNNYEFPNLQQLFNYINSGIQKMCFMYSGPLYRIHAAYTTAKEFYEPTNEIKISSECSDGSFSVIPITEYTDRLIAFSKSHKFLWLPKDKVLLDETAMFLRCDTGNMYGIDVNAFLDMCGCHNPIYEHEKEVLFPIYKENIIKEYKCTPNQFNYYMRNVKE